LQSSNFLCWSALRFFLSFFLPFFSQLSMAFICSVSKFLASPPFLSFTLVAKQILTKNSTYFTAGFNLDT
jgi:hypothetical protein